MAFHSVGHLLEPLPIGDGLCLSCLVSQQKASRLTDDVLRLRPASLRPVNGVTVSPVGRDSYDYN
ncbi:MAG: hypothetical protein GY721_09365 [Deltaproteobacteria bacterium]|nr:hypothetical protein [Deltaproteobacteria bacterium]